ncbi:MAG: tetratricopeptide repeat protein [Spirochaetes bacterium]|nr:tetratricopeptide repeat protein [Spirochaetota bacterium]
MSSIIIQAFLSVLVFGGFLIILIIIIKNFFSPRKISTLKNYIKSGNYKAAINFAKDIINKDRGNIEAHFYLGEAYYNQQKYELALLEYKTAEKSGIYQNINEKELREKLAELYGKVNAIDESLKEYILLTKKYPKDYLYFYKAGELFERKNSNQQAIKYYSDSIKLSDNYVPALTNIGMLLFEIKNYTEAQHYLQKAVNRDSYNHKAHFYLGMLKKKENNYKSALRYFEKSLRDKKYKVKSLMERGAILMVLNRYEEAIVELDRALKNCEKEDNIKINVMYVLANCYEKMRNITEAIFLWEQIYSIKPDFRDVSNKLSTYQEMRLDDRMKDFLTAKDEEFIEICKSIISNMGLNITDQNILSKNSIEFFCLEPDTKWRNIRKRPKLIHISRRNDPIDEAVIRKLHETMREQGVIRAIIITSSIFTKLSKVFAKERPIELIDKNGLQEILNKINL